MRLVLYCVVYTERRDWDVKTRLLGYEPQTEFEDGLTNVHGWSAENWSDIRGCAES